MPKRTNPFIDDYIPQCKVHVNLKQFNNNDDRLKKVYEKTLELLFKGAKKAPPDTLNNNDMYFTRKEEKMKQLFIGKDGSLLHAGYMKPVSISTKQCSCGGTVESQCAYCETVLCCKCEHGCQRCNQPYCLRCILVGSEGFEVCISCYG